MNTTKMSQEIKVDEGGTNKHGRGVSTMEKDMNTIKSALTVSQRVAICFAAGVIGAAAVVLFSHALFRLGLSATLGVKAPVSLKSPDIYRPLPTQLKLGVNESAAYSTQNSEDPILLVLYVI